MNEKKLGSKKQSWKETCKEFKRNKGVTGKDPLNPVLSLISCFLQLPHFEVVGLFVERHMDLKLPDCL